MSPGPSPATGADCCGPTPCGSPWVGRTHCRGTGIRTPLVFLTTNLPKRPSEGDTALRAAGPEAFFDAIEMLSDEGRARLEDYAAGGYANGGTPRPGFWTERELNC